MWFLRLKHTISGTIKLRKSFESIIIFLFTVFVLPLRHLVPCLRDINESPSQCVDVKHLFIHKLLYGSSINRDKVLTQQGQLQSRQMPLRSRVVDQGDRPVGLLPRIPAAEARLQSARVGLQVVPMKIRQQKLR